MAGAEIFADDLTGALDAAAQFARAGIRQECEGAHDMVTVMYHDQGHVPLKLIAFADGVNVTAGLPIIRASVGRGAAFDIAGKGVADATSVATAVGHARRRAERRRRGRGQW